MTAGRPRARDRRVRRPAHQPARRDAAHPVLPASAQLAPLRPSRRQPSAGRVSSGAAARDCLRLADGPGHESDPRGACAPATNAPHRPLANRFSASVADPTLPSWAGVSFLHTTGGCPTRRRGEAEPQRMFPPRRQIFAHVATPREPMADVPVTRSRPGGKSARSGAACPAPTNAMRQRS